MCSLEVDRAAQSALLEWGYTHPCLPPGRPGAPHTPCHPAQVRLPPVSDANLSFSESTRPPDHRLHQVGREVMRADTGTGDSTLHLRPCSGWVSPLLSPVGPKQNWVLPPL